MRSGFRTTGLVALLLTGCTRGDADVAELVLRGGSVWTGRDGSPGATALAVRDGSIRWIGSDTEADAWIGAGTRVVELGGRWVLPGFVDAHTHFIDGGLQLSAVELRGTSSPAEFRERIAAAVAGRPVDRWIEGGNWDEQRWGGELPRREWIDAVAPDHPVFVTRTDLHVGVANSRALELAGIGPTTPDPPGGVIVRDEEGVPTGVLKDAAMDAIWRAMPEPDEATLDRALEAAARHALSLGVTQVHDMGQWAHLETYRRARARGALPLRVYSVVPISTVDRLVSFVEEHGRGDDRLWWGGLKGFVDGSLGATTAWFREPYTDDPSTAGILTTDTTRLREWILTSDRAGLQVIVHAIGDRANDWLLDVFEEAAESDGARDRRFRVEHAQHLSRDAISRFGRLGVIPSMQPYHAADDGRWAEARIGSDRARRTYAFRSLLGGGADLAFGSDWTVAPLDPMLGLEAAVTRRTLDGGHPEGWVPEERITAAEAIDAYTRGAARAGFAEEWTGTLRVGARADLVVVTGDPFRWDDPAASRPRVDMTLVDGRIEYRRDEA